MNIRSAVHRSIFFLFLLPSLLCSQGILSGTVTDSISNETLIGANVFLRGTALGSASDREGKFRISGVPVGIYTLRISYIGYKTKEYEVKVYSGELTLDVSLAPDIIEGEEVVVTAQARGQVAAINRQITSSTIVNVVSEEKIQELPDVNAAEAIGRLPGVSLIRSGGEANKVVLRGLSSKFSNITIDNVKIPATDLNTRDVDLSTISQGSLAGVELFKTLLPDQDADAIAGSLNLVTKKAPAERSVRLDLKGDYNHLMSSADQYDFTLKYSERFFDGILGVQAQGSAEKKIRSRENTTTAYRYYPIDANSPINGSYNIGSFTVDFTDEDRTRDGGQLILDVNTPDSGSVKLSGLYSGTQRKVTLNNRVYPGITGANASWDYNYQYRELGVNTLNGSLQGKNFLGGFSLSWGMAYAHSRTDNPFDFTLKFTDPSGAVAGGVPSGPDHPEINIIPFATNDFTSAACSTGVFVTQENYDKERTVYFDAEKDYTLVDFISGKVKAGAKYRNRSRWMTSEELDDNNYLHSFSPIGVDTTRLKQSRFANYYFTRSGGRPDLSDFIDYPVRSRNLLGLYQVVPLVNVEALKLWYDLTKSAVVGGEEQYASNAQADLSEYGVTEKISAGYLMNTLNFGQEITFVAGVRFEQERNRYRARFTTGGVSNIGIRLKPTNPIQDTTTRHREIIWLPNLQLTVRPTDYLTVRLAAYRALARPDYNLRLPAFYLYGTNLTVGNPNLRDTKAWNYELNTQLYSNSFGLISVSAFYKVLDDLYHQMNSVLVDNKLDSLLTSLGVTWHQVEPFKSIVALNSSRVLTLPYNSNRPSHAWGVEFEHQMNFAFLPGLLKNFTLSYNLSLTRSETFVIGSETKYRTDSTLVRGVWIVTQTPFHVPAEVKKESEGQPRLYGNVALGYDIWGLSARLSLFYQDKYVQRYSGDGQTDIITNRFAKLDLALRQQITENIALFLNINNMTNKEETTHFRNNVTPLPWSIDRTAELYGTSIDFGVRISL